MYGSVACTAVDDLVSGDHGGVVTEAVVVFGSGHDGSTVRIGEG